jgi:hypothetical protein
VRIIFLLVFLVGFLQHSFAQQRKSYFPIWTFHQRNSNIHGLSIGLWSGFDAPRRTNTNGLKVELIGLGFLSFQQHQNSQVAQNNIEFIANTKDTISERINGVVASPIGAYCNCNMNGISISGFAKLERRVNGISFAIFGNSVQIHRGIQLAVFSNEAYKMWGIQIGLFNRSHNTRGIQIGIWNRNEKRQIPLINWNFKKRKK